MRPFPAHAPLAQDPDDAPFLPKPASRESDDLWDTVDNVVFEPLTSMLALRRIPRATNATALDEVADSSWFTNRIDALVATEDPGIWQRGPCTSAAPDSGGPWTISSGKPNGANPGFILKHANGKKYLFKLDGANDERPSTADYVGSRIYWAAGYNAPCNRIAYIDPNKLLIAPTAKAETFEGDKVPFTHAMLEKALTRGGIPRPDGTLRGSLSELIPGEVLGPWADFGTRDDDPNDIIPHEDRRELRGSYVLAALLSHYDAREQNSLDEWVAATKDGPGFIRHYMLDFGDCFGSKSSRQRVTRRRGHAYEIQWPLAFVELITFGVLPRPWRDPHLGPGGFTLGFYTDDPFEADDFHTAYPYGPFTRVAEADAAWAARILARMPDEAIRSIVDGAELSSVAVRDELLRAIRGRKRKLLQRYLGELSPLVPRINGAQVCGTDVAVTAGIADRPVEVCAPLPSGAYGVVTLRTGDLSLNVHVATVDGTPIIVGVER
ncbi:MAG TPA: hypothetical protein VGM90_40770 [Kofleriaceae bacterium]|jgi:hypothetical protein